MSRSGQNQVDRIGDVIAEKQSALPARDFVTDIKDRQAGHGCGDHHRYIKAQCGLRDLHSAGRDQRGQAQSGEDVENIAADDIPHGAGGKQKWKGRYQICAAVLAARVCAPR